MAKKVRRNPEEEDPEKSFQFPPFDQQAFLNREFEQGRAMWIAVGFAGLLGGLSYLINRLGLLLVLPIVLGITVVALSPFLIQRLRAKARKYTRGEWAGLILLELFGWLGIWFLLLNVFPF